MKKLFISYRRSDTAGVAGRICERLRDVYGMDRVFMDVDTTPLGARVTQNLQLELGRCGVLLVLVGPGWLERDREGGKRLENDKDYVRLELELALALGIVIVPILVGDATLPSAEDLPESLSSFPDFHALKLDPGADFYIHMERLIQGLDTILRDLGLGESKAPWKLIQLRRALRWILPAGRGAPALLQALVTAPLVVLAIALTIFVSNRSSPPRVEPPENRKIWGLREGEDVTGTFNDFHLEPDSGEGSVQFLWADPFEPSRTGAGPAAVISAKLFQDEGFLRVRFRNLNAGCNLAIRPKSGMPVAVYQRRFLSLRLRSPELQAVGVRVRLVDQNNVHWAFGQSLPGPNDQNLQIQYRNSSDVAPLATRSASWQTVRIPLDKKYWIHFYFDGPPIIQEAERIRSNRFSWIFLVILEVGFEPADRRRESVNKLTLLDRSPVFGVVDLGGLSFE